MKTIRVCVVACALLGVTMAFVQAAAEADAVKGAGKEAKAERVKPERPAKPEAAKPAMQEITVTGLLERKEMTRQDKAAVHYTLAQADGAVVKLPPVARGKDGAAAIDLDQYVGKTVQVTGMGMIRTLVKGDKARTVTMVRQITAVALIGDED